MKSTNAPESQIAQTLGIDPSSARKRARRKLWLVVIFLVAVCAAAGWAWKGGSPSDVPRYETQAVRQGDLTVIVTATGNLEPTVDVNVGSELSGILETVEVDYNQRVTMGQVLARLDTTKLQAEVTQSKAALQAAEAKVLQAQATIAETKSKLEQLQRVRELSNNKVPSQADFDAAQANYARALADEASAQAAVAQAKATLQFKETDLSKAVIRSPINGVVLTREVEPGQTVAASFQAPVLFQLAEDLTQMELHVDVDEADIGQVKEGQDAEFTVSAYLDRVFQARIVQVRYGSATVDGVVTYETVLKVDNTDLALRPGMTATANITVQKVENALLVPSEALRFSPPAQQQKKSSRGLVGMLLPGPPRMTKSEEVVDTNKRQQTVWVLRDGQPVAVPVTVGATDGTMTEIVSGEIQAGMPVIVDTVEMGR
ncbi:MAG TPA: efflux RND transporter periplasmic adaptor subunit [Sedimentisphaerales bacterium]|jgi:HlyD family secretion protein|nr:efflux RND transporter periplasmic adaptor subunit [Sedimentisphaerales bacterium]HNU29181.1 efflux RND transporter periplasmic adaptor subunit [Sedimentisphaerales bacterium]